MLGPILQWKIDVIEEAKRRIRRKQEVETLPQVQIFEEETLNKKKIISVVAVPFSGSLTLSPFSFSHYAVQNLGFLPETQGCRFDIWLQCPFINHFIYHSKSLVNRVRSIFTNGNKSRTQLKFIKFILFKIEMGGKNEFYMNIELVFKNKYGHVMYM